MVLKNGQNRTDIAVDETRPHEENSVKGECGHRDLDMDSPR